MNITVTELASRKINQCISKRGKGLGIKIGVKTTGCSGLAYVLEYVDTAPESDIRIDCESCIVFVDQKASPYVNGLTVDYKRQGLNEGFEFINPNEKDRCGCGSSFRI